ncbi:MAG: hypothetical protein LUG91_00300 [Ruminococcus sp.]|nr:hypothetical protein [Ruminococcus sp.]
MNPLIVKYCTVVLIDEESEVPFDLNDKKSIEVSSKPISSLMQTIESLVETERIVLVTKSESIAKYVSVFNTTRHDRYICLIKNGIVDSELAIKEYERLEMQLIDSERNEYTLDKQIAPYMYSTSEGRIVYDTRECPFSNGENFSEIFLKNGQEKMGVLLPNKYLAWKYRCSLSDYMNDDIDSGLDLLSIILPMCDNKRIPENILFFEDELLVVSYNDKPTSDEVKGFIYKILFGKDFFTEFNLYDVILSLADSAEIIPEYLIDFIEEQFVDECVCSVELCNYIFGRYTFNKEV